MRVPCTKCGTEILETTAKVNGGLCGPCKRGAGFCVICGERVWEAIASGEFIHMGCYQKRRDAGVVASSGISWSAPDEIDWGALQAGLLAAIRKAFQRIAAAHPNRKVSDVTVAYRIGGEGVRIEPCVTFASGDYLNASLDDDSLSEDLEPFDLAITRIGESLDDNQSEHFYAVLHAEAPKVMHAIFNTLEHESFGLPLSDGCTKTLKNY